MDIVHNYKQKQKTNRTISIRTYSRFRCIMASQPNIQQQKANIKSSFLHINKEALNTTLQLQIQYYFR